MNMKQKNNIINLDNAIEIYNVSIIILKYNIKIRKEKNYGNKTMF